MARQAPLFMEFSRQGYWNRLPFPPPGNLPDPGIECASLAFPALAGRFFFLPLSPWGIRQLSLEFVYSYFSCSLRYLWVILSFFLIQVFTTTDFPLSTAFAASHKFYYVVFLVVLFFNFSFDCFLNSLIVRSVLLNFHIFVNFPVFLLLLISSYILLWLEKIPGMISNFLNL